MSQTSTILGLDVGTVRIGVAMADTTIGIAIPYGAIQVDGNETKNIVELILKHDITTVVVGYPRNQSGEATAQTRLVEDFAHTLEDSVDHIVFQDESVTSIIAEDRLNARGAPFTKEDIDAEAATIILQDYMEQQR